MANLPPGISSRRVFDEGVRQKIAVLPGMPFYVDGGGEDTIRLNFSNPDEEMIKVGISRLADVINSLIK
jgi:2-aminoadipate transaminase